MMSDHDAQQEYDENPELRETLACAAESPSVRRVYLRHSDLPPEVREVVERGLAAPIEDLHLRPPRRQP